MAELSKRIPPRPVEEMPEGYERWLADVAARVRSTRFRIARGANAETIRLYWSIGRDILDRRDRQGWGTKVIERLSTDLQREFPGRPGFSISNLNYMRAMVAAWPAAGTNSSTTRGGIAVGTCQSPPGRPRRRGGPGLVCADGDRARMVPRRSTVSDPERTAGTNGGCALELRRRLATSGV